MAVGQNRKLGNKQTRNNISEISEVSEFSTWFMNMKNHSTVNLNYQISLLQRENTFIITELNNKQNITEKLLNINCNQSSLNSSKIGVNKNARVNEKNLKGKPLKYNKIKVATEIRSIMKNHIHIKEFHLKRRKFLYYR